MGLLCLLSAPFLSSPSLLFLPPVCCALSLSLSLSLDSQLSRWVPATVSQTVSPTQHADISLWRSRYKSSDADDRCPFSSCRDDLECWRGIKSTVFAVSITAPVQTYISHFEDAVSCEENFQLVENVMLNSTRVCSHASHSGQRSRHHCQHADAVTHKTLGWMIFTEMLKFNNDQINSYK